MGKQETKIIKILQKEAQSYLNAVHEPANHLNMFTAPEGNIPLDFSEEDKRLGSRQVEISSQRTGGWEDCHWM